MILAQVQASQIRLLGGTNCNQVDASGNCISCYFRWVLINGNCIAVSDQCKTWNSTTGACTSCYDGWYLQPDGTCTTTPSTNPTNPPNCYTVDANGNCIQCNFRYVLISGNCVAVSDQCKTWNSTTGACTSCYDGWDLSNGECTTNPNKPPNCYTVDADNNCIQCNFRWVLISGTCVAVSDQCQTWD